MTVFHNYYPTDLYIQHYEPNKSTLKTLATTFSLIIIWVLGMAVYWAQCVNPRLSVVEVSMVVWFALCGFLHCFFEGYFVIYHSDLAGRQSLFAQLWKEYSLSDSRYLVSDPFMLSIETVTTLLWGLLSWACVVVIAHRSPLRPLVISAVSIGHLYGVILYYATCFGETVITGRSHSRPEVLYFWVYFVGFNFPWVVVPSFMIWQSAKQIIAGSIALDRLESKEESNKVIDFKKMQ